MPRLVRPYVPPPPPILAGLEPAPAGAAWPVFDPACTLCPAEPRVVVWKVATKTTGDPDVWPHAGAGVLELQLCAHDATAHEDALADDGWIVVLDRRQALADRERR